MGSQESENGCSRLLTQRTSRHHNGGVGLVIGSNLAPAEEAKKLALRSRLLRMAIVVCLLGLFMAGGFASATAWDGIGSNLLSLEMATDTVRSGRTS